MLPVGFTNPADATRALTTSALPDAPVLDDEPAADRVRVGYARSTAARLLRSFAAGANRAAERVEPCPLHCGTARP
ncbi:MAG: hypothetical protein GEV07_20905 [Streptosporangiales bacterium]|nr:hypothetical protein [Streptosporangiales bacterium]